jgi:hypothetical protein
MLFGIYDAQEEQSAAESRGEIWMVDLGLAAKVRPVLVLSVGADGQRAG